MGISKDIFKCKEKQISFVHIISLKHKTLVFFQITNSRAKDYKLCNHLTQVFESLILSYLSSNSVKIKYSVSVRKWPLLKPLPMEDMGGFDLGYCRTGNHLSFRDDI